MRDERRCGKPNQDIKASWRPRAACPVLSRTRKTRFDLVVRPQFLRRRRIDHPSLAQHLHVVDEPDSQRGILLDEENGEALLLELSDRFQHSLALDRSSSSSNNMRV